MYFLCTLILFDVVQFGFHQKIWDRWTMQMGKRRNECGSVGGWVCVWVVGVGWEGGKGAIRRGGSDRGIWQISVSAEYFLILAASICLGPLVSVKTPPPPSPLSPRYPSDKDAGPSNFITSSTFKTSHLDSFYIHIFHTGCTATCDASLFGQILEIFMCPTGRW